MRVLVTGAAGFIGSHVAESLWHAQHIVTALDRKPAPLAWAGITRYVQEDINTLDVSELGDVEAVVHLAAQPGTECSWHSLEAHTRDNVLATGRLLQLMAEAGVKRLVHVSSSSVYGRYATGDESTHLRPISPYGVTKLAGEKMVTALCEDAGIRYTILRPFSVYGPRQRSDMFFHIAIEAMLAGKPITLTGNGFQRRSFTYVGDVVDAIDRVLRMPETAGGATFNVGNQIAVDLNECMGTLSDILRITPKIEYTVPRRGDQAVTTANSQALWMATGWTARVPLAAGLARQAAWHCEERQLSLREARQ